MTRSEDKGAGFHCRVLLQVEQWTSRRSRKERIEPTEGLTENVGAAMAPDKQNDHNKIVDSENLSFKAWEEDCLRHSQVSRTKTHVSSFALSSSPSWGLDGGANAMVSSPLLALPAADISVSPSL